MKKIIVLAVALGVGLTSSAVSAQSYYSYGQIYSYSGTGCASISRDLSFGMRGSDVSSLQSFLVSRNYPGSGSWMVTGYFGRATQMAVQNFQREKGLPQTGIVDVMTRAAMCGTTPVNPFPSNPIYPTYPSFPSYPTYPTYPTYPAYPSYPTYSQVQITSLSSTSAAQGAPVTIYGSGFDYSNNTVYVGSNPITNIASQNGTSLTFVVPAYLTGSVQVSVSNTRGQSNVLSLTIIPYSQPCQFGQVGPYNTNCGTCLYPYASCNSGMPTIQYITPTSGAVGASVSVYGSGFSSTGNTVRFGQGIIAGLSSYDGRSLSFTVPSSLVGYSSQQVTLGTYQVSVQNSAGHTSNTMPFTVTSLGSTGAPTISSVSGPSSLSTGTQGSWSVNVYNTPQSYTNYVTVSVTWGDENLSGSSISPNQTSYAQGSQNFTFTHTYTQPGTYTIRFTATNSAAQTTSSTATVTVSGNSSGNLTLATVSPSSSRVGTQIVLIGSGFNSTENTVRFGIGGTQHLPSFNGNTIYYTIPQYVSPCDITTQGQVCGQYFQQVTPGTYQIYVTNSSGTTNQLSFNVTN